MKVDVKIKDVDKGFKKLEKELGLVKGSFVTVGIHAGAKPYKKGGTSVVKVAATNEFGTDSAGKNHDIIIPERSFMRSTFDENLDIIKKYRSDLFSKVFMFQLSVKSALDKIGFLFTNMIKNKIENFTTPPNAISTQQQKMRSKGMAKGKSERHFNEIGVTALGYNDPLVNTRHMKDSVTFESHIP